MSVQGGGVHEHRGEDLGRRKVIEGRKWTGCSGTAVLPDDW